MQNRFSLRFVAGQPVLDRMQRREMRRWSGGADQLARVDFHRRNTLIEKERTIILIVRLRARRHFWKKRIESKNPSPFVLRPRKANRVEVEESLFSFFRIKKKQRKKRS